MQFIKTIVDELDILGKQTHMEDVPKIILNGLDQQFYKLVIIDVCAQDTPSNFTNFMKTYKPWVIIEQKPYPTPNLHHHAIAFVASHCQGSKTWHQNKQPYTNNNTIILLIPTNTPTHAFLCKCQFSIKYGHSLTSCYVFNKQHPHITVPPLPRQSITKPQAYMMTISSTKSLNNQWFFIGGASHHPSSPVDRCFEHHFEVSVTSIYFILFPIKSPKT